VVAVNVGDDPKDQVAKFIEDQKLPYVNLLNGCEIFHETYNGRAVPQTYVLDREGRIVYSQLGWSLFAPGRIEREIEILLKP
jgi:peroxiredoxin